MTQVTCELCKEVGGELVYEDAVARVVLVTDPLFPGFCRVIWRRHVAEMSDLEAGERNQLMALVWHVEQVLRQELQPHKINLASLGNMTPHLHWHVIPRYSDDAHFPNPVWGAQRSDWAQDKTAQAKLADRTAALPQLITALRTALAQ